MDVTPLLITPYLHRRQKLISEQLAELLRPRLITSADGEIVTLCSNEKATPFAHVLHARADSSRAELRAIHAKCNDSAFATFLNAAFLKSS